MKECSDVYLFDLRGTSIAHCRHRSSRSTMGNSFPATLSNRSTVKSTLKKSSSVREYRRQTSFINQCLTKSTRQTTNRREISLSRPQSLVRTDGEVIDIDHLRHEGDERLMQQLEYIYSCVRKDKGLFGK